MTADREAQLADLSQWPHELQHVANLDAKYASDDLREPADLNDANAYTSRIVDADGNRTGAHTIVLDLDVPARLVPSSTPGHAHLFIDCQLTWPAYKRLLTQLATLGVIEDGYSGASIARGNTTVRLPWVRKGDTANAADPAAPITERTPAA